MTRTGKLRLSVAFTLAVLLAVCAFAAGFAPVAPTAYAEQSATEDAVTAAEWGGIDADTLWYMASDELNLAGLKQYVAQYMLPALQAADAEPVIIAVIDTGINKNNGLFDDLLLRDANGNVRGYCSYYAAFNKSPTAEQLGAFEDETADYHGTRVASIMAVMIKELGLEDYIKLYPVKASYPKEIADDMTEDKDTPNVNKFASASLVEAVNRAVGDEVGADVVNMSMCATGWENNTAMIEAVQEAVTKATVVAAAGNDATSSNSKKYYPAAYDGVVGVMASADNATYHSTTNYGSAYDLFAPGENIMTSSVNGTFVQNSENSGTSLAAPMVSVAAALLKLRFRADRAATGEAMPRATVLTRLLTTLNEGDPTVQAKDGISYKRLEILNLISADYSDFEGEYLPVDGLKLSAKTYGGSAIDLTKETALTKCTLRENGRSSVTFIANTTPYGDTDPVHDADIVWTLQRYTETKDDDKTVQTLVSSVTAGKGKTLEYLFEEEGIFKVFASLTVDGQTYTTETAAFRISYASPLYDRMYIVPEDYVGSTDYVSGRNTSIPRSYDLYGKGGITLTITTLEDVAPKTVTWYVNGEIAAQFIPPAGASDMDYAFEFTPDEGFGEYKIVAVYDGGTVNGTFTVNFRSYAEHPNMIPVWCALGIWVVQFAVIGACIVRKRRQKAVRATATSDAAASDDNPPSPIRKK